MLLKWVPPKNKKYRNSVSCAKCKTYRETFSIYSILFYCLTSKTQRERKISLTKEKKFSRQFRLRTQFSSGKTFCLRYRLRIGAKTEINEENVKCEFSPTEVRRRKRKKTFFNRWVTSQSLSIMWQSRWEFWDLIGKVQRHRENFFYCAVTIISSQDKVCP